MRLFLAVAVIAASIWSCQAFSTPADDNSRRVENAPTKRLMSLAPPEIPMPKKKSYGEESRKYRRTVFTHDDWVKHRSPERFTRNLLSMMASGVYKNLANEVAATTAVATFVVLYNMLVGGYTDFMGVNHSAPLPGLLKMGMPLAPFTLSSPSLGLLLVFRTNTAYQRWDEARKNWGMNINHTRDLVRMGCIMYERAGVAPEKIQSDLQTLNICTWAFVRAMKRHLSPPDEDEDEFVREIRERLPAAQAEAILQAGHRPNRALFDLSIAIENLNMHFLRKNEIHKAATIFEVNLGSCERLLSSPVPLFYSRHLARFLSMWLLLLPFALYDTMEGTWNHVGVIPATALLSIFLFGIEELAAQMEEPFTILPMQAFCDKIGNWCNEIVSWKPGDNGMEVNVPSARMNSVGLVVKGPLPPETEVQEGEAELKIKKQAVEEAMSNEKSGRSFLSRVLRL